MIIYYIFPLSYRGVVWTAANASPVTGPVPSDSRHTLDTGAHRMALLESQCTATGHHSWYTDTTVVV